MAAQRAMLPAAVSEPKFTKLWGNEGENFFSFCL